MDFTLRQLAVFDAVARTGSVSRAAAEVHLTQPAASMALKSLEEALGRQLFIRHGKSLTLGEHGRSLQPMARSMLLAAEEMQRVAGTGAPREEVTVGASPTVADYLLDDLVSAWMRAHPDVRVVAHTLPSLEVITQVDALALDIGLIEMVTARRTLHAERWFTDRITPFAAPDHPLVGRPVTSADLAEHSWFLQPRFADSRREFTYALLMKVDTIDVALESDSIIIIKAAVSTGRGLGCLPRPCIAREIAAGTLVELDVTDLDLQMPFSIVTHRDLRLGAAHQSFIEQARSHVPNEGLVQ